MSRFFIGMGDTARCGGFYAAVFRGTTTPPAMCLKPVTKGCDRLPQARISVAADGLIASFARSNRRRWLVLERAKLAIRPPLQPTFDAALLNCWQSAFPGTP